MVKKSKTFKCLRHFIKLQQGFFKKKHIFFQTLNVTFNFNWTPSGAYNSSVTFWSIVVLNTTWGENTASLQYYSGNIMKIKHLEAIAESKPMTQATCGCKEEVPV